MKTNKLSIKLREGQNLVFLPKTFFGILGKLGLGQNPSLRDFRSTFCRLYPFPIDLIFQYFLKYPVDRQKCEKSSVCFS